MGASHSTTGIHPAHDTKPSKGENLSRTDIRLMAGKSGLEEGFIKRLADAVHGKNEVSRDEFFRILDSSTSGLKCEEIVLKMIWGFPYPSPKPSDDSDAICSLEDIAIHIGILSGRSPAKLAESHTSMVLTSLGTKNDSEEDSEYEITSNIVDALFRFLFDKFNHYGNSHYSAYELKYPFAQASSKYIPSSRLLIFRNSKQRQSWEVAKEFEQTFPRWLELLAQYISKDILASNVENHDLMIPLIETRSEILAAESFFHLSLAIGTSKGEHASTWDRLYLASEDGFSMNRFETKVFKYAGPTLTLLRGLMDSSEIVLAVYIVDSWQKSKHAWGGEETRVFEVEPFFEGFVPLSKGLVCYNSNCGIGIGPTAQASQLTPESFLLRVDSSFQSAYYSGWIPYPERPSFKASRFRSSPPAPFISGEAAHMEIMEIEVFGLGGTKALKRQKAEWQFETNDVERRANLAAFKNPHDPANRQILEMAGIISEDTSIHRAT